MATFRRQVSNVFAAVLMLFAAFTLQAHLTTQFTPEFAAQTQASIEPLNEKFYWPLQLDDEQLNLAFAAVNALNILSLVPTSIRKAGFMVNFSGYMVRMVANTRIEKPPFVHIILVWVSLLGFIFRDA